MLGRSRAQKCIFVLKNGFVSVPGHICNFNCNFVCELSEKKVQIGSENQETAVKGKFFPLLLTTLGLKYQQHAVVE